MDCQRVIHMNGNEIVISRVKVSTIIYPTIVNAYLVFAPGANEELVCKIREGLD